MSDDSTRSDTPVGDEGPTRQDLPPEVSILAELETLGHAAPSIQLRPEDAPDNVMPEIVVRKGKDRYELVGEIARGGVGIILRGRDRDIGRDVAMKVLRDEHKDRPEVVERFIEEAQIGGQLQHPGIVPIYELGLQGDERPYFTMKLVKGETLAALLAERAPGGHDARRYLKIFESVCQTMAYAHSRGVIHRDLKPANIMVGAFGEVQVVDWGLAKVLAAGGVADERRARQRAAEQTIVATVRSEGEGSDSIDGTILGTPAYMPPEQALGQIEELDERADVFALGGILCEILTGHPPYVAGETAVVVKAVRSDLDEAFERLEACEAEQEIKDLARACMSPVRTDRPRDAAALAATIATYNASVDARTHQSAVQQAEAEADTARAEREAAEERNRAAAARQSAKAAQARAEQASRAKVQTRAIGYAIAGLIVIGVGAWMWVRGDNAAVRRQARDRVEAALAEASFHEGKEDWSTAVLAADKAVELAESGDAAKDVADEARATHARLKEIHERVEAVRMRDEQDRSLVERLEQVRALALDDMSAREWDRQFALAFRAHDLDPATRDTTALVDRIRASPLAEVIATFLDEWALLRRDTLRMPEAEWRPFITAARAIDTNPWRNRLRRSIVNRRGSELKAMALQEARHEQSATTMALLGNALGASGDRKSAIRVLGEAHRRLPNDVWLVVHLARHHAQLDPPRWSEAARYYGVARALRPTSAPIRTALAVALRRTGLGEQALAELREAVRLQPDLAYAQNALGELVLRADGPDAALPYVHKALSSDPSLPQAHAVHAEVLRRQGKLGEAEVAAKKAIDLDRELVQGHENLLLVLADKDDLDGAWKAAEMAARYQNMAQRVAKDPAVEERASLRLLRRRLETKSRQVPLQRVLAYGLEREGRWGDAITAWKSALDTNGKDVMARKRLATLLALAPEAELRDLAEAGRLAEELLDQRGDLPGAIIVKGFARLAEADHTAAIAAFSQVLEMQAKASYYLPHAHYGLGQVYAARKDVTKAGAHLDEGDKARKSGKGRDPLLTGLRKRTAEVVKAIEGK